MTIHHHEQLAKLNMKAANRPRFAIGRDRKTILWVKGPGEQEEISNSNLAAQLDAVRASEAALQTDALVVIAAALSQFVDQTTERLAQCHQGCPFTTRQPVSETEQRPTPSATDGGT
jgi:hypothetical protein